jgi:hypothetical protein
MKNERRRTDKSTTSTFEKAVASVLDISGSVTSVVELLQTAVEPAEINVL